MRHLIALGYSPWSEKARWALDHHAVPYAYEEYVPMLGEPLLRVRAKKLRGRVSVPLLVDGKRVLRDSFDIARYAEEIGSGAPLFPSGARGDVEQWNALSERALAAGRVLTLQKTVGSEEAQRASLPPFIPDGLRGVLAPVTRVAVGFLARKYRNGPDTRDVVRAEETLAQVLETLRRALDDRGGGRPYILGSFSYADIAMAVTLQFVAPVADAYIALEPAIRACWTHAALAERFEGVVAWRDRLYDDHRRRARSAERLVPLGGTVALDSEHRAENPSGTTVTLGAPPSALPPTPPAQVPPKQSKTSADRH